MKKILAVITISLLLTGCFKENVIVQNNTSKEEQGQEAIIPQPAESNYADINKLTNLFGFTNESGKLILLADQSKEAESLYNVNKAIGENGNVLTIKYLRAQKGNEKDSGRQTSQNFDNLSGQIFEITQGTAKENETYYLANDNEFNTKSILDSQEGNQTELDIAAIQEIEKVKNRKVQKSWEIGKIESDKTIYLILFEREKGDMLASIVLKTPTKIAFKDYPAKYNESSTWRVDDGGSVYSNMFSVLFASKTETGIILGIKWAAFEGEVTTLLKEKGDILEELNIETSRYTSPI
jgi:hypothetical protein